MDQWCVSEFILTGNGRQEVDGKIYNPNCELCQKRYDLQEGIKKD